MKSTTEQTIASILNLDSEISPVEAQQAMRILNGLPKTSSDELPLILRFKEAAKLLNVSKYSVMRYAKSNILDKAYLGSDRQGLGVTTESYMRFIEEHTVHVPPMPKKDPYKTKRFLRRQNYEHRVNQARWKCHLKSDASNLERYAAVEKLLNEDPTLSLRMACQAAKVPPCSYLKHKHRPPPRPTIYQKRRELLIKLIMKLRPDMNSPVGVRKLVEDIRTHNVSTSIKLIKKLTAKMGYTIRP